MRAAIDGNKLDQDTVGLSYLDGIFRHRYTANHKSELSVDEAWHDVDTVSKAIISCANFNTPLDQRRLARRVMGLIQAPGHFRPACAASLFNHYKPKHIIDPMIGWGGRALAALCCVSPKRYVGIDLQKKSVDGVREIIQDTQGFTLCKSYLHYGDANIVMGRFSREFDMVMAGPPYYDTENYNGVVPTCTYNEWFEKFVTPFADNCHKVLKKRGVLALHIFDTHRYSFIEPFMEILMRVGFGYETQYIYSKLKNTLRPQYVHVFRKVR